MIIDAKRHFEENSFDFEKDLKSQGREKRKENRGF